MNGSLEHHQKPQLSYELSLQTLRTTILGSIFRSNSSLFPFSNLLFPHSLRTPVRMTSTVGDYLFWRLASSGATRVIGHNQNSVFLGSIQRNNLQYLNPNHHTIVPYVGEVGVFVASSQVGDIYACYQEMRQWFPQSPVVFVMELDSAQFTR